MTTMTFTVIDPARCNPDTVTGRVGIVRPNRRAGLRTLSGQTVYVRSTGHSATNGQRRYDVAGLASSGPFSGRTVSAIATSDDFELLPAPMRVGECTDFLCWHEYGSLDPATGISTPPQVRHCWTVTDLRGQTTHGHDGPACALATAQEVAARS